MSEGDSPSLRPQVIKRGDEYALINVDLGEFNELQRLGLAFMIWDQARMLMEANGVYRPRDPSIVGAPSGIGTTRDIDYVVAELLAVSPTSINRVRPRILERPEMIEALIKGELTSYKGLQKSLGMKTDLSFFEGGRKSAAVHNDSHFGLGDKFDLVVAPLRSYFRIWRKKEFRYAHVNPKEAKKRVKIIDEIMADLTAAREDLANRSHSATYRAPSEKRRENR